MWDNVNLVDPLFLVQLDFEIYTKAINEIHTAAAFPPVTKKYVAAVDILSVAFWKLKHIYV